MNREYIELNKHYGLVYRKAVEFLATYYVYSNNKLTLNNKNLDLFDKCLAIKLYHDNYYFRKKY